ncbi:coiled-coil-helix-coiled-coil-helix domain-containing protein 1 [Anguilla anguilla]|uniref:CHCH domain-containing protein n=1 Tax=Anguilla anguilla TaxID=7936 RepID=A0A9D3LIP3_ANGAN|nr:coiled-coil-helix-coiled-coil-helix domain-containing protein 1 [Anguilla anguilla]KAG5831560.1 hypothetical protein ANANG_G00304990 [Anguilla anguilla]
MATQGTALQQKVSRLLSRQLGKPVLKPNKPLALKNEVANRTLEKGEATCITEMSVLMTCWKQNEFNDAACSKEIQSFYTCAKKAEAARLKSGKGAFELDGRLHPKLANTLLKRFPNSFSEK